jgi:hypothetical protein
LQLAKFVGLDIPKSLITNIYNEFCDFYSTNNRNCIIKPIKSGLVGNKQNSKIVFTNHLKEIGSRASRTVSQLLQEHVLDLLRN